MPRTEVIAARWADICARQGAFYDTWFDATRDGAAAPPAESGLVTNLWGRLRNAIYELRYDIGIDEQVCHQHRRWLGDLARSRVLDLGCFRGSYLSFELATLAADYTGIDLSTHAIADLNQQLRARGLTHARGIAGDFLAQHFPDDSFDVVYASSVLHHFKDPETVLAEVRRILKPGGRLISYDPMMTNPLNRLARTLYRPLQRDRDWEHPFTRATLDAINRYFEVEDMRGVLGTVRFAWPFYLVPGLKHVAHNLSRVTARFDAEHTRHPGPAFYLCWHTTMLLRKPVA